MKGVTLILILVIASVQLISGHNWLYNPSRANSVASTYFPAPARTTEYPHVQVGRNQKFQLEWATGHGGYVYFVLIHADDEARMKDHSYAALDDYLSSHPNANVKNSYRRVHRNTPNAKGGIEDNSNGFFSGEMNPTDSLYAGRPESFKHGESPYTTWKYNTNMYNNDDVRIGTNTKYPWIKAVYKFQIPNHDPFNTDYFQLTMPSGLSYGKYVMHWLWRGYYDAIDIDYISTTAPDVYGVETDEISYTRIDHCYFPEIRGSQWHPAEVINNDPQWCKAKCTGATYCQGYQVLPYPFPSTVKSGFSNSISSEIPWKDAYEDEFKALNFDDGPTQVCYLVNPRAATETKDIYDRTLDPLDPIFYGTCFKKNKFRRFVGYSADTETAPQPTGWKFGDYCISCEDMATINDESFHNKAPLWQLSKKCTDCDLYPQPPKEPENYLVGEAMCDGLGSKFFTVPNPASTCSNQMSVENVCYKKLAPVARDGKIYRGECLAVAERDPECSKWVIEKHESRGYYECYCFRSDSCCKCSTRRQSTWWNLYELTDPTPDPDCRTGLLSADGAVCCSGTCDTCNSLGKFGTSRPGYCDSDPANLDSARLCTKYGPPCIMA